jgi:lipid A 3-O-deacylase
LGLLKYLGFAAILAACADPAVAQLRQPWTIVLMLENDSPIVGYDKHYTSGLYAAATSGDKDATQCGFCTGIADAVMFGADGTPQYRYGLFLGQSMFTPQDLLRSFPDPKDRPYAGWLYVGGRIVRESDNVMDTAEVSAGVVGPGSGADAVQRWWHALHWFGGVPPQGWHAQIKDEPGIVLHEQRIWRISFFDGAAELLPEANVSLGNVFTYAGAGATIRVGRGLNADWGLPRIAPALQGSDFIAFDRLDGWAWNLFAGIEGRAIARNITLDGNSFQNSPNVDKLPFVGDFNAGAAITAFEKIRASLSYTLRSPEFHDQHDNDAFVSIALSYSY